MSKFVQFFLGLFFCLILLSTPALANEQDKEGWPSHLTFFTGPNGGQWFFLGTSITEILNTNILPTSMRLGGGVANIKSIAEGQGDIGFTLSCFMGAASSGEEEYKILETENIEIIANVYPQVLYVLLRKDFADKHNIESIRDLLALEEPVRFASLKPGTASEFIVSMLLKYGYNTNFEQLKKQGWQLSFNNYAETADNFVAGDLDCFAYTAGTDVPLIKIMEDHLEVIILPVEEDILSLLADKFQTSTYIIEPGDYTSITEPIATLGDYTTIIVRKDLPDTLVYKIIETLYTNKSYIAKDIIDFNSLSPDTAIPGTLAMHPGALKFWNDMEVNNL